MLRVVQLSDLHLPPDASNARWRALDQLLDSLERRVGAVDRLVLTGDLSTHGQRSVYVALRARLAAWLERLRLVPGNHDVSARVREVFGDRLTASAPAACFVDALPGLRLVGLDSSRPWRVSGRLGHAQLAWLATQLADGAPSALFMHHPPLRVGAWWLDKDRLRDRAALEAAVQGRGVLGLFCGHVHQPFEGSLGAVPVWTAPSTAYQFAPRSLVPRTHPVPAAFRLIELQDGALRTRVVST